jgi:hypothetical protein
MEHLGRKDPELIQKKEWPWASNLWPKAKAFHLFSAIKAGRDEAAQFCLTACRKTP